MEDLLKQLDPRFLLAVPTASVALKFCVDALRKLWPRLDGGYVQVATGGAALVCAVVTAASLGIYADGATVQEGASTLVLAWMLMTGTEWVNEAGKRAGRALKTRAARRRKKEILDA
jgi:hypothetical protein